MKRIIILATLLLQIVLCAVQAQQAQQMPPVPLDPAVKTGTLPNGLTYYIRHNEWPENRMDFYIVQKVGSVQEEENQLGLAHFLEHMCFNGTTHFPSNNLKQYLERIGVKFGENLNAYTSFDKTVYFFNNVNKNVEGALDSCLMILHDWSHDLLLEDEEIEKERGVINEEWRVRRDAMSRMQDEAYRDLFAGSRYANRMPIGSMDVVMNFNPEDLRSYYRRWYRPDLQAVIVVGDVDVNEVENKIKAVFSDIEPAAADASERIYFPVADNNEPIVSIQKDPEFSHPLAFFFIKTQALSPEEKGSMGGLVRDHINDAISNMLGLRLGEITRKASSPILFSTTYFSKYMSAQTKDALTGIMALKENRNAEAVETLYREILRAQRFGFTQNEYDRYQKEYISRLEAAYNGRDKVENKDYAEQYVDLFLENEPCPGIEWEYTVMKQLVSAIPLDVINQTIARLPANNRAVVFYLPEKDGTDIPTKDEILQAFAKVEAEDLTPVAEKVNNAPLVSKIKSKVKVQSITDDIYGAKLVTLTNGIKIHILQTDYSPNQIQFKATSWGGASLYPEELHHCVTYVSSLDKCGWGAFNEIELNKKLSGIQAGLDIEIGNRTEKLTGSCVKKDFETLLQLVYLYFTSPHRDDEAWQSHIEQLRQLVNNRALNPIAALQDSVTRVLYNNKPRTMQLSMEDIDKFDYDFIARIYRERFANAADFEFYLVGDINAEEAAPLLAKYIGAIPAKGEKETYKDIDKRVIKGEQECIFEKEQSTPNAIVIFHYHAPMEYSLRNKILTSMLQQSLYLLFTETVREDEGGAYGVPVQAGISDWPEAYAKVLIQLATAPEKRERMTEIIYEGIEGICQSGPTEETLQKIKEYMLRSHAENLKNNDWWMDALTDRTRLNFESVEGYEDIVKAVTVEDLRQFAAQIFHAGNRKVIGMTTSK